MKLNIQQNSNNIDWHRVTEILQQTGMAYYASEIQQRAFKNSFTVVFVFDDELLVGFGRAISDGEYQAAVYDVAVAPDYQGKGIGKIIMQTIISSTPNCNFILYASPGKEDFYKKEKFKRMKTGMALFINEKGMTEKGFIE
jgi:GNAT superfamily N-acetyltransferase